MTFPPIHPMLVHFAVAFCLLAGLGQLAALLLPRVRAWFGWTLPAFAVVNAVLTKVAESFGEQLAHRLPESAKIHEHAEWGEKLVPASIALALFSVLFWLARDDRVAGWTKRRAAFLHRRPVALAVGVLAGLAALAVLVLDVLAGHSGAVAVWLK